MEKNDEQLNKILLSVPLAFRPFRTQSGDTGMVVDGSSLQFIVEEFISSAASKVAIDAMTPAATFVKHLPIVLRERVIIVDKNQKTRTRLLALFEPFAEEFQITMGVGLGFSEKLPKELSESLATLFFKLHDYLLGLEYGLQVDIDFKVLRSATTNIKRFARNPEGRTNLAVLSGILSTYKTQTIPTLRMKSYASSELVDLFQRFVEDRTYELLSHQAHLFGFPHRFRRAIQLFGRFSKRIASNELFKPFVSLISKSITLATRVPTPDSELYQSLINRNYLPPIISTKKEVHRAMEQWKLINPTPIPPPGHDIVNIVKDIKARRLTGG